MAGGVICVNGEVAQSSSPRSGGKRVFATGRAIAFAPSDHGDFHPETFSAGINYPRREGKGWNGG